MMSGMADSCHWNGSNCLGHCGGLGRGYMCTTLRGHNTYAPSCGCRRFLSRLGDAAKEFGWVRKIQKQKRTTFIHLDDGSKAFIQIIIANDLHFEKLKLLTNGSSISVVGNLKASPGRQQSIEMVAHSVDLIGECDPQSYTIGHRYMDKGHLITTADLDYLREHIHLRPRVRYFQSILRLRSELQNAIQIFMKQNQFIHVTTPMVTANDCEGGGECFVLNPSVQSEQESESKKYYFGRPTFLTVSGQLHLEAMARSCLVFIR
ncbi:hypothetical protein RDWZM_007893 [Blomia tropicalis]|uniref:Uncharacterized protein n=1 Tax=Blomia tropicalis TaxID=40697 RepID=A0A9Q0M0I3_BLOTA|nr:hypothetical protein RDWZM_007893 [Blomia tropicalis]